MMKKWKEHQLRENQLTVRNKLGISKDDFLIVTGGKIDEWKTQTLLLMEAVHNIDRNDIKRLFLAPFRMR